MQLRGQQGISWASLLSLVMFGGSFVGTAAELSQAAKTLRVAAIQFRSSRDLADNVNRMTKQIHTAATNGVRVVVFPECALSGYFEDVITNLSSAQLTAAEEKIAQACREGNIWAIVGSPSRDGKRLFNSALVISPEG